MLNRRRSLILMGGAVLAPPALAATGEDAKFAAIGADWLDAWCRSQPVTATQLGDHRFDSLIDDMSAKGRAVRGGLWRGLLSRIAQIDRSQLSRDNQVDAAILKSQLEFAVWDDQVLQSWAWDALVWSNLAGGALYLLVAREFAPVASRLKSATARMKALPALLEQMRASIVPARVPAIHATTVAKQNSGVMDIVDSMIVPQAKALAAADQAALKAAAQDLRKAMAMHQQWLDKVLVPQARGDFRIGAKLFDQKLAFTLNSSLSRKEIRARAEKAVTETRAQMFTVAQQALAKAGKPATGDQQQVIAAALALASADRPARGAVVATAKSALAEATDFVKTKQLITLPSAPVEVIIMPKFQQGVAVAYCDPPGPLEKTLKTFYAVSPIPDEWSQAQTDSFLKEYSKRGIADIAVHEAMPGHYVQGWHSNRNRSMVRAVLGSGSFVEGWAVYAENMMAQEGFRGDDPLYRLVQLKVYLRSITNAIIDQAIHCDGMGQDAMMKLLTQTAFQEEREAAGKWDRARMSATQLSTYFVGRQEHDAARARAEKPPGFGLKAYHDKILSFGSPPGRLAAALYFGDAIT